MITFGKPASHFQRTYRCRAGVQRQLLRIRLSEAHPTARGSLRKHQVLVGITRNSGTPALYTYSSCSAAINGTGSERLKRTFPQPQRPTAVDFYLIEPTPWLDYKSAFRQLTGAWVHGSESGVSVNLISTHPPDDASSRTSLRPRTRSHPNEPSCGVSFVRRFRTAHFSADRRSEVCQATIVAVAAPEDMAVIATRAVSCITLAVAYSMFFMPNLSARE